MSNEEILGEVDVVQVTATDAEVAAAIAEIEPERAGADDRSGE